MISSNLLRKTFPLCTDPEGWAAALAPALARYNINSKARLGSFLAQVGYESGQLNQLQENLSYATTLRLMRVWPKRFPNEAMAKPYVNNQARLANYVYANRMGNGNEMSGDGYRYRGRGLIQITGRSNYAAAGAALGLDLLNHPDLLLDKNNAAVSAAWLWDCHGLNALADDNTDDNDLEDFSKITKTINGGTNGLQERLALLNQIQANLG
jgi:putative chitinase